ncbi:MAG: MerR family transcriptional regulator [Gemmatimonadaceae bacterium]
MGNARGPRHQIAGFPIRIVAERTGLTPAALRAWERRYRVVQPTRSEGSQRLYSPADIDRLKLVAKLADEGHSIGALAKRSTATLEKMARGIEPDPIDAGNGRPRAAAGTIVDKLMSDARAFDASALRATITAAILEGGADSAMDRVLTPFLSRVGQAWACGDASVAHEHLASAVARDSLGWLLQSSTADESAPALIAATIAGEAHEFGVMMAAITAARAGWRVVYLGANIPAEDLAQVARTSRARVVALGIVADRIGVDVRSETAALRKALGSRMRIVAGGSATANNLLSLRRANIEVLDSRSDFIEFLASLWTRSSAA